MGGLDCFRVFECVRVHESIPDTREIVDFTRRLPSDPRCYWHLKTSEGQWVPIDTSCCNQQQKSCFMQDRARSKARLQPYSALLNASYKSCEDRRGKTKRFRET